MEAGREICHYPMYHNTTAQDVLASFRAWCAATSIAAHAWGRTSLWAQGPTPSAVQPRPAVPRPCTFCAAPGRTSLNAGPMLVAWPTCAAPSGLNDIPEGCSCVLWHSCMPPSLQHNAVLWPILFLYLCFTAIPCCGMPQLGAPVLMHIAPARLQPSRTVHTFIPLILTVCVICVKHSTVAQAPRSTECRPWT